MKKPNWPKWKVIGPTPSGDIVDYSVHYSARQAKKEAARLGEKFKAVPIKRKT